MLTLSCSGSDLFVSFVRASVDDQVCIFGIFMCAHVFGCVHLCVGMFTYVAWIYACGCVMMSRYAKIMSACLDFQDNVWFSVCWLAYACVC